VKIYYLFLAGVFILTAAAQIVMLFSKNPKLIKIRSKLPKPIVFLISLAFLGYGVYYIILAVTRY
jgi:hypothetical protein